MEVPVVASEVGGLRDTVRDGETGLLVEPESPKALADAIAALLADPARRLRMGHTARKWVLEQYELQHTLDQWIDLFQRARDRVSAFA
jgi:glycosyltransferase involved in cell wall biosynthesis